MKTPTWDSPVRDQFARIKLDAKQHTLGYKGVQSLAKMHVRTIPSAINEWIDNSRDADAERVDIAITQTPKNKYVERIIVKDNGHGMDFEELFGAFEIGHDRKYSTNSIGKYGLGGTMSSLNLFSNKVILTKTLGGSIHGRAYDMEKVKDLGMWSTFQVNRDQIQDEFPEYVEFLESVPHGTVVINYNSTANRKFNNTVNAVKSEIGQTFSCDLKSGYFSVCVNDVIVKPKCALGSDLEGAIVKQPQDIIVNGVSLGKVTCISLRDAKFARQSSGVLVEQSGFGFYRVDRLIAKGVWPGDSSGMFPKNGNFSRGSRHPDTRYTRLKVEFTAAADELFGVRSTKDSVQLDQSLADVISSLTSDFVSQDASVVKARNKKKSAETFEDRALATVEKTNRSVHAAPKKKLRTRKKPAKPKVALATDKKTQRSPQNTGSDWLSGGTTVEDLGFELPLSIYLPEDSALKFNKQHPSFTRIANTSETAQEVLTEIFVAIHSARIETTARLEGFCETTMTQFLQTLDQKFRAIIKE